MDNAAKEYMVQALRKEFIGFMQNISKIPGAHVQKQQAFLRFDEGHMWMQNAILSYVAPQPEPSNVHEHELNLVPDACEDEVTEPVLEEQAEVLPVD